MLFSNALVRTPGHSVIDGIDDYANLGQTDYPTALAQHQAYVTLLPRGDRHRFRPLRSLPRFLFCGGPGGGRR